MDEETIVEALRRIEESIDRLTEVISDTLGSELVRRALHNIADPVVSIVEPTMDLGPITPQGRDCG